MRLSSIIRRLAPTCLALILCAKAFGVNGPAAWEVGQVAPDTYGYDQNGTLVNLRDYAGKNVIFEVSTAWCYPSFQLAAQVNAAKQYLAEHDVPFEFITVISETPFKGPLPTALRSQGLAWCREFNCQYPVLSFFNGPIIPTQPPIVLSANWLVKAAGSAFPAIAFIGPDQIIKKLHTGLLTADELVAEYLPDQPPLPAVTMPPPSLVIDHARVSVKVGRKIGSSLDPFVDASGPYAMPLFQRGNLPKDHAVALSAGSMPQQNLLSVHYDGHIFPFDGVPGFPDDKRITITLSNVHWERTANRATLATPVAKVTLSDNISSFDQQTLEAAVTAKGGKIVIGPFTLEGKGTSFRLMDVDVLFHVFDPSLKAAFLADYVTLQFGLTDPVINDWNAQLRVIETAAKTPGVNRKATLTSIDELLHTILRYKGPGLPKEGRRFLVQGLSRIRQAVRDAKPVQTEG